MSDIERENAAMPPVPSIADQARRMLRGQDRAMLATLSASDGAPYASLILIACDHDATPLMLISDLADHTKNIRQDSRASLLIDTTHGLENPLTGARVSFQGRIEQLEGSDPKQSLAMQRFLRRHRSATVYGGFKDFNLYRMKVARAHLVAGFGKIHWLDQPGLTLDSIPEALALQEADVIAHMNQDHSDAIGLYANRLLGLPGVGWQMTGIDPEGADLRRGSQIARISFQTRIYDAESARVALVRLVKQARMGVRRAQ